MTKVVSKEAKKFTDVEMEKVEGIKKAYNSLTIRLGQLEIERQHLNEQREKLDQEYNIVRKEEVDFVKQLSDKYGQGNLNLDTGVFVPAE